MRLNLPPPGVEAILLTLVLGAAVYDVRYRRIPNWLTVGGVLVGLAMNVFLGRVDLSPGWPALRFSLLGFKGALPKFPDDSTANQFFNEARFEAYRELGFACTNRMLDDTAVRNVLSAM